MKMFIKKYKFTIISIVFVFAMSIVFCLAKRTFHSDESLTFALTNVDGGWVTYDTYGWFERDFWSGYAVSTPFNYSNVYNNQVWDVHPPLYYYLLHTIMSLFPGRLSIWFGLFINISFYFLDTLIIGYIIIKYTKKDMLAALTIVLFGLNNVLVYGLTFIRMYIMSSFFALLFLLFGLRVLNNEGNKWINYLFIFLTTIAGGLTHYQFYMVVISVCLCVGIYLLIKKRWIDFGLLAISTISALLLNVFKFFRGTLTHFSGGSSDRASSAFDSLLDLSIDVDKAKTLISSTFGGSIVFVLLAILLVLNIYRLIKSRKKEFALPIVILLVYFSSLYLVLKTSENAYSRYLIPIESIAMLGLTMSLYVNLKDIMFNQYIACGLIVIITLCNMSLPNIDDLKTKTSWDFAREHQDALAYIVKTDLLGDFNINTLFMDLRWYMATAISSVDKELECDTDREYVLYIQNNLDQEEALEYVKSQLKVDGDIVIEKQDIKTTYFYVYLAYFQ